MHVHFMKGAHKDNTNFVVNIASTYKIQRETYKMEWFSSTAKLPFEDTCGVAPVGYDSLLKRLYGDYMTPPPEDKRGGHNVDDQFPVIV